MTINFQDADGAVARFADGYLTSINRVKLGTADIRAFMNVYEKVCGTAFDNADRAICIASVARAG